MPASDRTQDLSALAERLTAVLAEAGTLALRTFRGALRSWTKDKSSPVSEADIAVNDLLHAYLGGDGYGWLSEESVDDPARLAARRVWVVDPIDGTRAYIAGLPDWTIVAALVEDGRPVVAAIHAPVSEEMFVAIRGGGAFRNGVPIRVSDAASLSGARLAGPRGYLERLQQAFPDIVPTPRIHSLALRFTRVAEGTIDAAMASHDSHDWDLAAADLLVHEAGGILTNFAGRALLYNQPEPVHAALLAAGRSRHARLIDIVNAHIASA